MDHQYHRNTVSSRFRNTQKKLPKKESFTDLDEEFDFTDDIMLQIVNNKSETIKDDLSSSDLRSEIDSFDNLYPANMCRVNNVKNYTLIHDPSSSNPTKKDLDRYIHILKDDSVTNLERKNSLDNIKTDGFDIENETYRNLLNPIKPNIKFRDEEPKTPRMDWNNYHRLDVIHAFMDELEYDFPSICTTGAIGKSLEGRDLKILKISNSDTRNQCVWIDAGIHAREWIAPAVATYVANHIARNFNELPESITNKDWYFLPVVNPDGYEYSHTTERMWRKNRAWHGGACVGVDLNRNFSYGWGGKGSSGVPTNVFYRGPEPFSEPESSAIRDILMNTGISFKIYITLHSYGQVIIFPFAFKEELCPDYVRLLEGATVMSKAINACNGNIYKVGVSNDVMYGAAGTSYDFSYGEVGIPFSYLIELRSRQHKFKLPQEEIEETGNEILNCVKALMAFVDDKYKMIT